MCGRLSFHMLVSIFFPIHVQDILIYEGDCLISSGDDGVVRFWKKALTGEWLEYAETDMAY